MKSNENRWVDLSNGITWAIIFSLVAIVMSIIALATRYPRTNLSMDYMGVIVGILSLLVTALMGWQIYNAIDLHRIKHDINQRIDARFKCYENHISSVKHLTTATLHIQTHLLLETISKGLTSPINHTLLNDVLIHLSDALNDLKDSDIKSNIPPIYEELQRVINFIYEDIALLKSIKLETIDKIINSIILDNTSTESINKIDIINQLLRISQDLKTLTTPKNTV